MSRLAKLQLVSIVLFIVVWCIQAYTIHFLSSTIDVQLRVIKNYETTRDKWDCFALDGGRGWDYKLCSKPRVK